MSAQTYPPTNPAELAEAHWLYVSSIMVTHGVTDDVVAMCRHHYLTAFIHGYKHATEDCTQAIQARASI